jgi:hypothetical protein
MDLLGLARDFIFDITAANNDRIVFSSQGSGIQSLTFYSEGDLTDDLAFYLYGIWTFDGVTVPPADLRLILLKTRNGLPAERYNVTDFVTRPHHLSPALANIATGLNQQCATLADFLGHLQEDRFRPSAWRPDLPGNFQAFLPHFPDLLEDLLAKALIPFRPELEANIPTYGALTGIGRQTGKPDDFHYTWQKQVDHAMETLGLNYERGVFRMVMEVGTASILDILLTS